MLNKRTEDLPLITDVLENLVTPGTVLMYPEKEVTMESSPQTAVKTLQVNICSTESNDLCVLHHLHSKVKQILR